MDTDFHYYGTGAAAVHTGIEDGDAAWIANAAEYVDWFNSDFWSKWSIVDDEGEALTSFDYPRLSCQSFDWKMIGDYDVDIWNAYHFLPGNADHEKSKPSKKPADAWQDEWKRLHVVRRTCLEPGQQQQLCRPYSPIALELVLDMITKYGELDGAVSPEQLTKLIQTYLPGYKRAAVKDGHKLALTLLGIRMHILADTWAHQDFTGAASKAINGAGTLNYIFAGSAGGPLEPTTWTGTLWVLNSDTDCAAAPNLPGDAACRGHGQVGHFADYSWLSFVYPAAWLPKGGYLLRDNPSQYVPAWRWLAFVMAQCTRNGSIRGIEDVVMPPAVEEAIREPHALDSSKLFAVSDSEETWKSLKLLDGLCKEDRWNVDGGSFDDARRQHLGVADDGTLPTTRFGTLRVKAESILHYMELASAIHYEWCINWARNNRSYGWQPKRHVD